MKKNYSIPKSTVYCVRHRCHILEGSTDNTGEGPAGTDPDVKEIPDGPSIW